MTFTLHENLHVHLVPRMSNLPEDLRGPNVFGYQSDGATLTPARRDEIGHALVAAWPT